MINHLQCLECDIFFFFIMSIFQESSFSITFVAFQHCNSEGSGAGISFNIDKLLVVRFCLFYNCSATGGSAIYTRQGITNISQICTENCVGRDWASDIIFYKPSKFYVKEVQSTSAQAGAHSFYVSAKSNEIDSFYINTINISSSRIIKIENNYGIGMTFWLYKDSLFSYIVVYNSSSANNEGGIVAFDTTDEETYTATFEHSIFVDNQCHCFMSSRDNRMNSLICKDCYIYGNILDTFKDADFNIQFFSCQYDFNEKFQSNISSTDENCEIINEFSLNLPFDNCKLTFINSFSCKKHNKDNIYPDINLFSIIISMT